MSKSSYFIAAIAGGLSFILGSGALADVEQKDLRILNRSKHEVGDFGPRSNQQVQILDERPLIRDFREAPMSPPVIPSLSAPGANNSVQDSCSTDKAVADDLKIRRRKAIQQLILGNVYATAKDFEQAVKCYESAVALDPSQANLHFNLACAAWNVNKVELSSEHFLKTIQLDDHCADAYFGLAQCKKKTKHTDEAITALKDCVRLEPSHSAAWLELGRAYELVSDDVHAEDAYRVCLSSTKASTRQIDEAKASLQKLECKRKKSAK